MYTRNRLKRRLKDPQKDSATKFNQNKINNKTRQGEVV